MTRSTSRPAEALRALGIFNPYNAAVAACQRGGVGVYVTYRPAQTGRASQSAAWQVIDPDRETDPGAYWRNHGAKTFNVWWPREQKADILAAALKWASGQYPEVTEWVRIPGLRETWFPAQDAALIKALLKEGATTT